MEIEGFVVWLLIGATALLLGIDFVLHALLCVLVLVAIDLVTALTLWLRAHTPLALRQPPVLLWL